jgi:tetratricopeptide (TPR) repeat protein
MIRGLVLLLALAMPSLARANDDPDPDEEAARRHFERGRVFYGADDYVHALEEFQTAQRIRPRAALDFNIGRCHDRLEHYEQAITAYQRYVDAVPTPSDAGYVRERMRILGERIDAAEKKRAAAANPAPARPAPTPARRTALIVGLSVGAAALTALVVGLAVGLSQSSAPPVDFGPLRSTP